MTTMTDEQSSQRIARLRERAERERRARIAAEDLLEVKSRELYDINHQLELRVKERTHQLEATLANIVQGVVMRDKSGDVIVHNDQVMHLLGLPPGSGTDAILREISALDSANPQIHAERRTRRRNRRDVAHPDGRYLELVCNQLADGGQVLAINDITVLKRRQMALEEANRAANDANTAKSQFLSTLSHEIRTPLNGVLGCVELLKGMHLDQEQARLAEIASCCGDAMLQLVNDVLDLSRIDNQQESVEARPMDIVSMARASCLTVESLASQKNIEISVEVPDGGLPIVVADRRHFQQVLVNLIGNAIKFSIIGPIRVKFTNGGIEDGRVKLLTEVIDNGIGIAPENCSKIFDDFWQVGSEFGRSGTGSGLGLAICRRLIERMGGTIGVTSQIGHGSTFYFELRLPVSLDTSVAAMPERKLAAAAGVASKAGGMRILLAEDNDTNALVATEYLRAAGYSVERAKTGREVVIKASKADFDLVFMDISMPELDGVGATHLIRWRGSRNALTPVVALTAHATTADQKKILSSGLQGFVTKPVRREILAAAVETYAGKGFAPPAAQDIDASGVIDPAVLGKLGLELGETMRDTILRQYLIELDFARDRLIDPETLRDVKSFTGLAHAFAGASSTIGATQLAQDCLNAEWMLEAGSEDVAAIAGHLTETINGTIAAIDAYRVRWAKGPIGIQHAAKIPA